MSLVTKNPLTTMQSGLPGRQPQSLASVDRLNPVYSDQTGVQIGIRAESNGCEIMSEHHTRDLHHRWSDQSPPPVGYCFSWLYRHQLRLNDPVRFWFAGNDFLPCHVCRQTNPDTKSGFLVSHAHTVPESWDSHL